MAHGCQKGPVIRVDAEAHHQTNTRERKSEETLYDTENSSYHSLQRDNYANFKHLLSPLELLARLNISSRSVGVNGSDLNTLKLIVTTRGDNLEHCFRVSNDLAHNM